MLIVPMLVHVAKVVPSHKQLFVPGAVLFCPRVCLICLPLPLYVFGLSDILQPDSISLCLLPTCLTCAVAV